MLSINRFLHKSPLKIGVKEKNTFIHKACFICDKEESEQGGEEPVERICDQLGWHVLYVNGTEHDVHLAYISGIFHITSFSPANTLPEKEKDKKENVIFELAIGGVENTVSLAKSNSAAWRSVGKDNKANVSDVYYESSNRLWKFKPVLEK